VYPKNSLPVSGENKPITETQGSMNSSKMTPDKIAPMAAPRSGFPAAPAIPPTSNPIAAEGMRNAGILATTPSMCNKTTALLAVAPTNAPTTAPTPDILIA
jgi:hypothetical protein